MSESSELPDVRRERPRDADRWTADQQDGREPVGMGRALADEAANSLIESIPLIGDVLGAVRRATERRSLERQLAFIRATLTQHGELIEGVVRRLETDVDLADLFEVGRRASETARTEEKVRLLAAVVRSGAAGDPKRISEAHIIMRMVAAMEPEHMLALRACATSAALPAPDRPDGSEGRAGSTVESLAEGLGYRREVVKALSNDLEAFGVIENRWDNTWGGMDGLVALAPTGLGEEILVLLGRI